MTCIKELKYLKIHVLKVSPLNIQLGLLKQSQEYVDWTNLKLDKFQWMFISALGAWIDMSASF